MIDMTEEMAIGRLKEFYNNECYVLLSTVRANMILGFSIPYIGQMEQGKLLVMFDDLNYAKKYIDNMGFEVLDGVYPLAKIDNNDKGRSLETILNIAAKMEIFHLDINPGHEETGFGVDIRWMQHVLGLDTGNVSILISEKEMEELKKNNDGQVPLRFNGMPILEFTNPYIISEERQKEIGKIPFENANSKDEYIDCLRKLPINELCNLSETIVRKYIPMARANNKEDDVKFFESLFGILDQVIIHHLFRLPLLTLLDNGELFINNGQAAYLIYTDRFKYMGEYRHEAVDIREFVLNVEEKGIDKIFVTNGPNDMHLTSVNAIKEYIKNNL